MKILIIHTHYKNKGGEDTVFQQEYDLLSQSEKVKILSFQNQTGLYGAIYFLVSIWNIVAARKIKKYIIEFQPDIIHIHNWHFAIGPIAIWTAKKTKTPIVMTLHNFRLLCPSSTLFNNGRLFTHSINAPFPWKAIRHKVYRNSYLQTFWLAFVVWFHKKIGTWNLVNKYIVHTEFAKDIFVHSSLGVPMTKFIVNPNFLNPPTTKLKQRKNYFLFIGRLSEEKGIQVLLDAFQEHNYELHIGGDGPLKEKILEACRHNEKIKYIGHLDKSGVQKAMQECTALVFPSVWYEGMPMTILEAFALGTPVITSKLGAMASMIQHKYNGLHFEAGNKVDLIEQLNYWTKLDETVKAYYEKNALATYENNYTPKKNKEQLLNIYRSVLIEKESH